MKIRTLTLSHYAKGWLKEGEIYTVDGHTVSGHPYVTIIKHYATGTSLPHNVVLNHTDYEVVGTLS